MIVNKRLFSGLLFFVACCIATSACATPKLNIPSSSYAFGAVAQGQKVSHEFQIHNEGDEALEIQRVVPSCGCTVSRIEKKTLAPGEETVLSVDFDTRGMSGAKVKTVRLYTNDPAQLTALVTLKGEVHPDIMVSPSRVHFGEIVRDDEEGEFVVQNILIRVREGAKGKIGSLLSRSPWITVESVKTSARSVEAAIRLRKDAPLGEFRDRIAIQVVGGKEKAVNLPLYASIRSPIQVKPQVMAFGIVHGTGLLTKQVRIENKGPSPLKLVSVHSDSPSVSPRIQEKKEGKVFLLEATLNQGVVKKDLKTAIRVTFQDLVTKRNQEILVGVTAVLPPEFLKKRMK